MLARFGCLSVLPWILFAQMSWDLSAVPVIAAQPLTYEVPPEVNDQGGFYSQSVKREARRALRQLRYHHRVLILVETVKPVTGENLEELARQRARPLGAHGIYVLAADVDDDKDVAVILGRGHAHGLVTDLDRAAIRDAFLGPLQDGQADKGLEHGIQKIRSTLAASAASKPLTNSWDAVLPLTIVFVLLVVLMGIQVGHGEGQSLRQRRTAKSMAYMDARVN